MERIFAANTQKDHENRNCLHRMWTYLGNLAYSNDYSGNDGNTALSLLERLVDTFDATYRNEETK